MTIITAEKSDLPEILSLQHRAYQSEAALVNDYEIPPLKQALADIEKELADGSVILKAVDPAGKIIGSVRGRLENQTLLIGKLIVQPDLQGQGIGTELLRAIEAVCPHNRCELFTSDKSVRNIQLYERVGYTIFKEEVLSAGLKFIYLEKR